MNVALTADGWSGGTTAGVEFVSVPCTTMTAVPVTPLTVTLIVATPSLTARTRPLEFTLATDGSLLEYVTRARERFANDSSLLTASTMLSALACGCSRAASVSGAIHGLVPVRLRVWPAW